MAVIPLKIRKNSTLDEILEIEYEYSCYNDDNDSDDPDIFWHVIMYFDMKNPEFCTNSNHKAYWKPISQCEELECVMAYISRL